MHGRFFAVITSILLMACASKPYDPPVIVNGAPEFQGLAHMLDPVRPLDVVLVHGMCTHDERWAYRTMDQLLHAVDSNLKPAAPQAELTAAGTGPKIQIVRREDTIAGSKLRFTALVWSPLTAPLKQQLAYDGTGTPTDCAATGECKPTRAKYNGMFKDGLLNDCLADALIYEGASRPAIRGAMSAALSKVLEEADANSRLVLVSSSLGSKLVFDALDSMMGSASAESKAAATAASARLGQVFMNANQLPLLGLADQNVSQPPPGLVPGPAPSVDSLQKFLRSRQANKSVLDLQNKSRTQPQAAISELKLVAFTDPNDLLSYRLMPSRYKEDKVNVVDILVSNDKTYFGLFERPDTAHTGYGENPAVAGYIACGWPRSALCK